MSKDDAGWMLWIAVLLLVGVGGFFTGALIAHDSTKETCFQTCVCPTKTNETLEAP